MLDQKVATACGSALLPLKTKVKGPAPPAKPCQSCTLDQQRQAVGGLGKQAHRSFVLTCPSSAEADIIDEAISFFRANVLFRTFQSQGPADLTLAYLTAFIAESETRTKHIH
jgi:actin related protein 2/3 complex subunit 3